MKTHHTVIGVLHIILGAFAGIVALIYLVIGVAATAVTLDEADTAEAAAGLEVVGGFLFLICGAIVAFGLVQLATGALLLFRHPAGKMLGIAISALSLLSFPLGTALGGYGLWALLSSEGAHEYKHYQGVPDERSGCGLAGAIGGLALLITVVFIVIGGFYLGSGVSEMQELERAKADSPQAEADL